MSRATRPRRSLRLARSLQVLASLSTIAALRFVDKALSREKRSRRLAQAWAGTSPSVLRRCILGRPVSARAAGRLLAIVGGGV